MYNEVATLIKKVDSGTVDDYGDPIFTEERKDVFVGVKSVKYTEFYTAQTAGYDPNIIFVMADYFDYDNQPLIEYNGEIHKVIRTYRTGAQLEVVCQHYQTE